MNFIQTNESGFDSVLLAIATYEYDAAKSSIYPHKSYEMKWIRGDLCLCMCN